MKKIYSTLLLSIGLLALLTACGGSSNKEGTQGELIGSWQNACMLEGTGSKQETYTFTESELSIEVRYFNGTSCDINRVGSTNIQKFLYTVGNKTNAADGTESTEITWTNGNTTLYTMYHIDENGLLHIASEGGIDGLSAEGRFNIYVDGEIFISITYTVVPEATTKTATTTEEEEEEEESNETVVPIAIEVLATGDFNGDGTADLLRKRDDNRFVIWFMNASGKTSIVPIDADSDWVAQGAGDFNGDGNDDILWKRASDGNYIIWTINATGRTGSIKTEGNSGWSVAAIGDFNADGHADIAFQQGSGQEYIIHYMNASGKIGAFGPTSGQSNWSIVGTGDFDNDGFNDILWQQDTKTYSMWLLDGSIKGAATIGDATQDNWSVKGIADFGGDSNADILWQRDDSVYRIWQMNGTTRVVDGVIDVSSDANSYTVKGTGDVNGDGNSDIIWDKSSNSHIVWTMSSTGRTGTIKID